MELNLIIITNLAKIIMILRHALWSAKPIITNALKF